MNPAVVLSPITFEKKSPHTKMGVDKTTAGEFLAIFTLVCVSLLTTVENLTMGAVFEFKDHPPKKSSKSTSSEGEDKAKSDSEPKYGYFRVFNKLTLMRWTNFGWYAAQSTWISAFVVFYLKYDGPTISNEDNADFYVVSVMYSLLFVGVKLAPHALFYKQYESKDSYSTGFWLVLASFLYNMAFSVTLTVLYFLHDEPVCGSLQLGFSILLIVLYWMYGKRSGKGEYTGV